MNDRTALCRIAILSFCIPSLVIVAACPKYTGPGTTVTITNNSGAAIRNVEVSFAKVGFGVPGLGSNESHTHWIQPGTPCHIEMKFDDVSGRAVPEKQLDFGETCPRNIALDVDSEKNVSGKAIQK